MAATILVFQRQGPALQLSIRRHEQVVDLFCIYFRKGYPDAVLKLIIDADS